MAKLDHSKRRVSQATYAQVSLREAGGGRFQPRRPLLKMGLLQAGRAAGDEVQALRQQIEQALRTTTAQAAPLEAQLHALAVLAELDGAGSDLERIAGAFGKVAPQALESLAERLIQLRESRVKTALTDYQRLAEAFDKAHQKPKPERGVEPPAGWALVPAAPLTSVPGKVFRREERLPASPPANTNTSSSSRTGRLGQSDHESVEWVLLPAFAPADSEPAAPLRPSFNQLSDWAQGVGSLKVRARELQALVTKFRYNTSNLMAADVVPALQRQIDHSRNVLQAFRKQMEVEPVGFLHLERLTFAPDGIERGELVYSLPLAPGEEVNLAHKEWATTAEEFEKIVTDSLEEYSEEGVTETAELAQSTSSQRQHSMGFNTSVTASGGYGPVNVTSSVSLGIQQSASSTAETSRNQSIGVTRKASSRAKKEHKITFRVVSAQGSEDQTVRRIKNPSADTATRADYYQLIRKWEVNVYRYGIRLTYDLTIPEPGSDILSKIVEINRLNAALQQGFGAADSQLAWARFDVKPAQITRANYATLAAQYGAALPAPPSERRDYNYVATHDWKSSDEAEGLQFHVLECFVDEEYEIDQVRVDKNSSHYLDEPWQFVVQPTDDFLGKSGKRQLVYRTKFLGAAYVEVRIGARLRDAVYREWQLKAWTAMRDAAQGRYYEMRLNLKEKLSRLQEELGGQDALSLRKLEREEVMKGVLRWLFGPDFEFVPAGLPADLYDGGETVKTNKIWKEVLAHGELIKFLHHAIEWENVIYMLYPYFWSHYARWEMKKYLDHPDPMHRAFLKAGSARVVLTIRPGFERDFVSFLETGSFAGLPATHPYMTIIDEMEAYAHTNYPGIPPANPEQSSTNEEGVLIGSWHEYTPTSALDIAFGETLPTA